MIPLSVRLFGRRSLALAATALLVLLAGCGGGGGVGTGGTGSFASGPITGFGSVIVNDIVFDDSDARVEDGDGGAGGRGDLRLGMIVEIDSDAIQGGRARAERIRYDSALVGPVDSVDLAAGSFVMLGQTVTVDATTVFDERLIGRLALVIPGGWVEVYALYDPALQRFRATRIEARLVPPLVYRIRGVVTQLDTASQTFRIGAATFGYAAALNVPADLANGQFVRLALRTTPPVAGRYSVAAFSRALRSVPDLDSAVVKGLVTEFVSLANFRVDGRPVDATGVSVQDGPLTLGARVEVSGAVRADVLRATTVRVRSDAAERDRGFDLRGTVESFDVAERSFVLRGLRVTTSRPDLRIDNGSVADLVPTMVGRPVEVRGQLAPNGVAIEATRIRFE